MAEEKKKIVVKERIQDQCFGGAFRDGNFQLFFFNRHSLGLCLGAGRLCLQSRASINGLKTEPRGHLLHVNLALITKEWRPTCIEWEVSCLIFLFFKTPLDPPPSCVVVPSGCTLA